MTGKLFINYRRGDDPGFTQALYQRLEEEFSAKDLFMDVEGHIRPGDDFVEVLNEQISLSDILLVVIGPRWLELLRERSDDADDFVQIEIAAAFDQGKRVVPVLVGGSDLPSADDLPVRIRSLVRRNAVGLRPERFRADCQGLVAALKGLLAEANVERAAKTEAEREAAEAAHRKRDEEDAARIAAAERRTRDQAMAGLSSDEIRKAEELSNWQFIERRDDASDLRDHLARFPGGMTDRFAQDKLETLVWSTLDTTPSRAALEDYLEEFPKGEHAPEARSRLAIFERREAEQSLQQATERASPETDICAAASAGDRSLILIAVFSSAAAVVAVIVATVGIGLVLFPVAGPPV